MEKINYYLKLIQTEQIKTAGKVLSKIYKGSSKSFHYASKASKKLKMPDAEKYLLKHRDSTYEMSRLLKNNPSPENVKVALSRVAHKTAIGIVVGLIVLYAYKNYLRNWSKAGRYCKGTSGTQRTACLRRYKIKVLKERLENLNRDKSYCIKSKNPEKCREKVDNQIKKIKERINVLQTIEERRKDRDN